MGYLQIYEGPLVWEDPPPHKKPGRAAKPVPEWVHDGFMEVFKKFPPKEQFHVLRTAIKFFNLPATPENLYRVWHYNLLARRRTARWQKEHFGGLSPYMIALSQRRDWTGAPRLEPLIAIATFPARMGRHKKQPLLTRDQLQSPDFEARIKFVSETKRISKQYEKDVALCPHHWLSDGQERFGGTKKVCEHCGLVELDG